MSVSFDPSPQQAAALRDCATWATAKQGPQVFRIFGYAGTGKTTCAQALVAEAKGRWLFAAYTGKAALVMARKGCTGARTIHSLIYKPVGEVGGNRVEEISSRLAQAREAEQEAIKTADDRAVMEAHARVATLELELRRASRTDRRQPAFSLWEESPLRDCAGVVIDECSMVDERLGADLLSFGKKVLVLGDPAQLPPVGGGGFFTNAEPDHLLTEVHRHARESGILDLATFVREGGDPFTRARDRWSTADCDVRMQGDISREELQARVMGADQVLVGLNRTRHAHNRRIRQILGRTDPFPLGGDRVICLRNDRENGLMNGGQWYVGGATHDAEAETVSMALLSEDLSPEDLAAGLAGDKRIVPTVVTSWDHHFVGREEALAERGHRRKDEQEFDYAYAITTHKAQGSQWRDVVVFDESRSFKSEWRRWLYTAVTRASERLMVVV